MRKESCKCSTVSLIKIFILGHQTRLHVLIDSIYPYSMLLPCVSDLQSVPSNLIITIILFRAMVIKLNIK